MTLGFNFIGSGLGTCSALVVSLFSNLSGVLVRPFLHLVQSPFGVFALGQCLPEVGLVFVEKLRIATYCLGSMGEGVDSTELC